MMSAPARVLLCATPVDMRRSFDGLASLVTSHMRLEPSSKDALFVFVNASRTHVKALWMDDDGASILYRRLDALEVALPDIPEGATSVSMDLSSFHRLLRGARRATPSDVSPTVRDVARSAKEVARKIVRERATSDENVRSSRRGPRD